MKKTVAVDFDGTLTTYPGQEGVNYDPEKVGEPVSLMVRRVKIWLANDVEVVILTARAHPYHKEEAEKAKVAIQKWCLSIFGKELEVTHEKHPRFIEIWDDKAVRIIREKGTISDGTDVDDPLVSEESDSIGSFLS